MTVAFSIIIPTRNERNNLERLLPILINLYPQSPVFIVDDDSPDDTAGFVKQYSADHSEVHLILRKNKRGRGSAVIDGLKEATEDKRSAYFLEMDADFSHNPGEIRLLISQAEPKTIVIGSRHIPRAKFVNCSAWRVFLSHLANFYAKSVLQVPLNDYTNGFRLYPRNAAQLLINSNMHEKGYIMLSETAYILYKKGFKFKEVPTIFVNRKLGRSNATLTEFLKSIPGIIKIRVNH